MLEENNQLEYQTSPQVPKRSFFSASSKPLWVAAVTGAVCVAGLLAYLLLFRGSSGPQSYQGDVKVAIDAPAEIPSGAEISYQVKLKNLTNVKLTKLELELFYPEGFTFIDATPDVTGNTFSLPDLAAGAEEEVVIVGKLEGNIQEVKSFHVKLRYVPENFRSTFVAESSASIIILAPELALAASGPAMAVTGSRAEYHITVTNIATRSFSNVVLRLQYPEKFEFIDARPTPSLTLPTRGRESSPLVGEARRGGAEWTFQQIDIGESVEVTISGQLLAAPGGESVLAAELFLSQGTQSSLAAGRSFVFTEMRPSPLKLSHAIIQPEALFPGSELKYQLTYHNTSSRPLTNVSISVIFDPSGVDLKTLRAEGGQVQGNTLVFIPAAVEQLRTLQPGQSGKFEFTTRIKEKFTPAATGPAIHSRTEFTSVESPEPLAGDAVEKKIGTKVTLAASAKQVGSNTYHVTIDLGSSVNEVRDAEIFFLIPRADMTLAMDSITPNAEQDNVTYNPAAGSVRWRVGSIFAFSPDFHEGRILSFDLQKAADNGDPLLNAVLIRDLKFSATDSWTGDAVETKIEQVIAK